MAAGDTNLYLHTDTSNTGIGAWLGSGPTSEEAVPIAYGSRTLLPAEKNYPVHKKELLAMVHALKQWRPLLLGLPIQVLTNHATLQWVFKQPNLSERQKQWLLVFAKYDLCISHIPGASNVIADTLSCLHVEASLNALSLITTTVNQVFLKCMANGYKGDSIMGRWLNEEECPSRVAMVMVAGKNGKTVELMKWGERICVPEVEGLQENV